MRLLINKGGTPFFPISLFPFSSIVRIRNISISGIFLTTPSFQIHHHPPLNYKLSTTSRKSKDLLAPFRNKLFLHLNKQTTKNSINQERTLILRLRNLLTRKQGVWQFKDKELSDSAQNLIISIRYFIPSPRQSLLPLLSQSSFHNFRFFPFLLHKS